MSKPTIHFAFSVPLGTNIFRRAIDKFLRLSHLLPLHRFGWDFLIPWQWPIRSPHCISYFLLHAFEAKGYKVRFYNIFEHTVCKMKPQDIFIGMPVPANGYGVSRSGSDDRKSVTSRTIREYPHNKNFVILPYSHDPMYVDWSKEIVKQNAEQGGGMIFVGGEIWARNWQADSPYADINFSRKLHVIMGINEPDYPLVKKSFNPKGKRKFIYIGHNAWYKNPKELENIAERMPQYEFAHIGAGEIKGWKKLSTFESLTPAFMTKLAREYDAYVSVSKSCPGTTAILEQMCFGLVVAATPETGYEYSSLIKLSKDDTEFNTKALEDFQNADESDLFDRIKENRKVAKDLHNWERFTSSVIDFMGL